MGAVPEPLDRMALHAIAVLHVHWGKAGAVRDVADEFTIDGVDAISQMHDGPAGAPLAEEEVVAAVGHPAPERQCHDRGGHPRRAPNDRGAAVVQVPIPAPASARGVPDGRDIARRRVRVRLRDPLQVALELPVGGRAHFYSLHSAFDGFPTPPPKCFATVTPGLVAKMDLGSITSF